MRILDKPGAADEYEYLHQLGVTDGLPVVPPTVERVVAMLGGRSADVSLGTMAPSYADVTVVS